MAGQRVQLPPYSMFSNTPVYEVDGVIQFGLTKDAVVPDATDEMFVVPSDGVERLDLISYSAYGTPELWWVIARVNNIQDPLVAVPVGTPLRIPTRQRLASEGILNA